MMGNNNLVRHDRIIAKSDYRKRNGHAAMLVWFTGLSGSGKSTLAHGVEESFFAKGWYTYLLDGDNVRHGLCRDLGFSEEDRVENIRRVGEVAKLFVDAGVVVLAAFISPYQRDRDIVRALFEPGEFVEVYVQCDLAVCEQRDPKGLYRKARAGEIQHFTGLDSPYEAPVSPELVVDTAKLDIAASIGRVQTCIEERERELRARQG